MFALVEIAGMQYRVQPNEKLVVPLLPANPGEIVEFGNILAAEVNSVAKIGTPYISGNVKARVLQHGKGEKVLIFKKKRRKGYQKYQGHRAKYTEIEIGEISIEGSVYGDMPAFNAVAAETYIDEPQNVEKLAFDDTTEENNNN